MPLSQEVYDVGRHIAAATPSTLSKVLNDGIGRFLGWPYKTAPGSAFDRAGVKTDAFASIVFAESGGVTARDLAPIPADNVAAVIDACETLDLDSFRAAYARIAQAKSIKKMAGPRLKGTPTTTVTLGIIFALRSDLPLENLANELERMNARTPSRQWPDMVVLTSTGVMNYAVQFPGEGPCADYLPPEEGATDSYTAPFYVLTVMRPTGTHSFNKMMGFLVGHLAIFSPGARLPPFPEILAGTPLTAVTLSGYQYNLKGELVPVPRQYYNDRYIPQPPYRIESRAGERLSTIQFLPWQDGATLLLKGKLPLDGFLVLLGKKGLERSGIIRRPPDVQLSYVIPISRADFSEMLKRFQRQSNMVVRIGEGSFVVQKVADEGSSSPFYARVFMGIMRLRDQACSDPTQRDAFDKPYEFVTSSLVNARTTVKTLGVLWERYTRKVASGEVARVRGRHIQIDESIDNELRKEAEAFLNAAVRALKQGMQDLSSTLGLNIGFMFRQQTAFEAGIAALQTTDRLLAEYLRRTRAWSEPLLDRRNAMEHEGWTPPPVSYNRTGDAIKAVEPEIAGRPATQFVGFMLDRLCCFVEELTAHCLQARMPPGITIAEIPHAARLADAPERFTLTLAAGGLRPWKIEYHTSSFDDT